MFAEPVSIAREPLSRNAVLQASPDSGPSGRPRPTQSSLFAHLTHELRTPLNAVLGYAALLREGAGGELPDQAARMLERIAESALHLRALVDDVLDYSRLDAGRMLLSLDQVALDALVHDMLGLVEPQAREKGLELVHCGAHLPLVVTDPRRVRQIILNLLSNAIKFTERGRIAVSLVQKDAGTVAIRVRDTGIGISARDRARIFDEFVQVSATRGGTGLGLAISRRLAHRLGGDLKVISRPGRGSCFTLSLPISAPAAEPAESG